VVDQSRVVKDVHSISSIERPAAALKPSDAADVVFWHFETTIDPIRDA
jgi:hypothetical protein